MSLALDRRCCSWGWSWPSSLAAVPPSAGASSPTGGTGTSAGAADGCQQDRMAPPLAAAAAGRGRVGGPGRRRHPGADGVPHVQRVIGWLLAASGALNTVVAVLQLWWVWSGRGDPPPRH